MFALRVPTSAGPELRRESNTVVSRPTVTDHRAAVAALDTEIGVLGRHARDAGELEPGVTAARVRPPPLSVADRRVAGTGGRAGLEVEEGAGGWVVAWCQRGRG